MCQIMQEILLFLLNHFRDEAEVFIYLQTSFLKFNFKVKDFLKTLNALG
jgi:hypothetical protein